MNNKRLQLGSEKSATLPRNMHSKLNASKQSTPTTSHANGVHRTPMHLSNESKTDQIHERVNHLQNSTAKATIRMATQSQPKLGQDAGVVDGYLENVSILKKKTSNRNIPEHMIYFVLYFFCRVQTCIVCIYKMRILSWQSHV